MTASKQKPTKYHFGFENDVIGHELNDTNFHELRDELVNQEVTNQLFLFEGKNDLNRKTVETFMPLQVFEAFADFLQFPDERYDEGSTTLTEAQLSIRTDRKKSNEVKRSSYG